jgi:hypothetical protein
VDSESILLHQVHPVKLAFDIGASVVSNALLWQHRLAAGIVFRYLLPVLGPALVLSLPPHSRGGGPSRSEPAGWGDSSLLGRFDPISTDR